jgi:hypothetical protein
MHFRFLCCSENLRVYWFCLPETCSTTHFIRRAYTDPILPRARKVSKPAMVRLRKFLAHLRRVSWQRRQTAHLSAASPPCSAALRASVCTIARKGVLAKTTALMSGVQSARCCARKSVHTMRRRMLPHLPLRTPAWRCASFTAGDTRTRTATITS